MHIANPTPDEQTSQETHTIDNSKVGKYEKIDKLQKIIKQKIIIIKLRKLVVNMYRERHKC